MRALAEKDEERELDNGTGWPAPADIRRGGPRVAPPIPLGTKLLSLFATLLAPAVAGYLLFDRAFAYLHVPGTPLYVGECLLVIGIAATLLRPAYVRRAITQETLVTLLVGFMAWGLIRAIPGIHHYGVNGVRDSALWYYGLFAVLVVAATAVRPDLPRRLVRLYSRFIPWLLAWLPFALVVPRVKNVPIFVPGSPVNIFNHKPGNVATAAAIALAFMWLVPDGRRSAKARNWLSVLALFDLALVGTQNRAGFLAGVVGIVIALVFLPRRLRLIGRILAVAVVGLVVGLLVTVQVQTGGSGLLGQGRTLSASQLVQNVTSIGGSNSGGNLNATVAFRDRLWTTVFDKEVHSGKVPYGFGFGPNLAILAGVGTAANNPDLELRSPHNSHFDVLARMGVVGMILWITLWVAWFGRLLAARRRNPVRRDPFRRGVTEICIVAAAVILVDAFFDPTLEGAQVATFLWTVFGIGVLVSSRRTTDLLAGPLHRRARHLRRAHRIRSAPRRPLMPSSLLVDNGNLLEANGRPPGRR